MATIYRALSTALLLLWGYVLSTGLAAADGTPALAWHLNVGLVATLVAGAVQSLPFAYFLGTHFWVKAWVRACQAGDEWEQRQRLWMKGNEYPWMYIAPFVTALGAIAGGMAETGRIHHLVHPILILAAMGSQVMAMLRVPRAMLRNSALMDELAELHQPPKPDTPEMEALLEAEQAVALPPMFQLSRVLLLFSVQSLLLWSYLRWGTDGYRRVPLLPFGVASVALLVLGLGLNARFDPDHPASPARSWAPALLAGVAAAAALTVVL
ncbi:MAG: hypothetical protein DRQ55_13255 [Planctomycetota bacterium]|nr:MAG: hypothetical protein DRQ55_13255 [Planctomycetota bacterium]